MIAPILKELERRQPDVGIGERPRGPLIFRVAERLSLISDALYLEATDAQQALTGRGFGPGNELLDDLDPPDVSPTEQAIAVAKWIYAGRGIPRSAEGAERRKADAAFPGVEWLRQPETYSDREWILEIAQQYRSLERSGHVKSP
jgi:hypothetical protein